MGHCWAGTGEIMCLIHIEKFAKCCTFSRPVDEFSKHCLFQYRSLAPLYYRDASAAIVVYDITNQVRSRAHGTYL